MGHLVASPTLAGLRLCPLNLQGWKRPLSTTGVCVWSNTTLAPAHHSVLDSIFPPRMWVYFLSFELDYVFKLFSSFCVCFYRWKGPSSISSACCFAVSYVRARDQGQKLGTQWRERNRNRKWNPTRKWKKQEKRAKRELVLGTWGWTGLWERPSLVMWECHTVHPADSRGRCGRKTQRNREAERLSQLIEGSRGTGSPSVPKGSCLGVI